MCRIFAFRSVINSQVHRSLVSADNALIHQSERHPDGWGVAYYVAGAPHIIKSVSTAIDDTIFHKVSGVLSAQTVLAHLRRTTGGSLSILNTHPFQYGRWTFAHNGEIAGFHGHRQALVDEIAPEFRRFLLGETDSEVLFFLFLTHLAKETDVLGAIDCIEEAARAARGMTETVTRIAGPYSEADTEEPGLTFLTFLLTNGTTMLAHQGGKGLSFSTYKKQCADRDVCPSFSPECEAPSETGKVNHLIFSSEPPTGENIWFPMKPGQMIGVDGRMTLRTFDVA